ncbi:PucR family transcriptional regulator [Ferviditalea candida]|uniref:Helix-turn-helix domain-containing protein n=1 Tax=Ferviditalea candida TaxID=3108399 RepID=A0ABU5ZMT7_9BACL|nr:helix-turn-helix domain-containing protein [Paenibacillaceae bacterium T2]
MNWGPIIAQLELILNADLSHEQIPLQEWNRRVESKAAEEASDEDADRLLNWNHTLYFVLNANSSYVETLKVEDVLLTHAEKQLVAMTLEAYRHSWKKSGTFAHLTGEEGRAAAIREWIDSQIEQGTVDCELPEMFQADTALYASKLPILLSAEYADLNQTSVSELKKLLESFFGEEVLLIPLQEKEWIILGTESLLYADEEEAQREDHRKGPAVEETLESIATGLHEMLASEWIGECHLAVAHPMVPAKSLLAAVIELRRALALGRTFRIGSNVHLPWKLQLEQLLDALDEAGQQKFVGQVFQKAEHLLDPEMLRTLEQFFELDCNVSETAKILYIHRNTLLYRLDRFKQETGLDVRTFNHAVLVKLALTLHKAMKRKTSRTDL